MTYLFKIILFQKFIILRFLRLPIVVVFRIRVVVIDSAG